MVDTVKNSKLFWCVRKFSSYQFKVLVVKLKFVHNRVLSCHKFLDKSLPTRIIDKFMREPVHDKLVIAEVPAGSPFVVGCITETRPPAQG